MKRTMIFIRVVAIGLLSTFPGIIRGQTVVFDDTFASGNGDTTQSASPGNPTGTSTAYEYFQQGATPSTPTFGSGFYHVAGRTTTSSISENQALFTTSPVALATIGDYIDLAITFTNTSQIYTGGGTINAGMFNSGGSKPDQGVRLDSSGEPNTTGAGGWIGYVGRIGDTGAASEIYTRPVQGAGTANPNQSQDVLFNGASGSSTYNNPNGTIIGSTGTQFSTGLTAGSQYTLQLRFTLSATGVLTISNAMYSGNGENAANILYSQIDTTTAALLTNSFDALAFGWRFNSTSAANAADFSQILVSDFIQTGVMPSPKIFGLHLSGTTLTFSATNGQANGSYALLESTNPALPFTQWTPVFTNAFDGSGDVSLSTNVVNTANTLEFYILQELSP